jgi:hypothetical protein
MVCENADQHPSPEHCTLAAKVKTRDSNVSIFLLSSDKATAAYFRRREQNVLHRGAKIGRMVGVERTMEPGVCG